MTIFKVVGRFLLILTAVNLSEECSPPGPDYVFHPQNQFCSAKFIMVGQVLSTNVKNGVRRYRVRVLAAINGFKRTDVGKVKNIYTPDSGAACGITLTIGKVYALGAHGGNDGKFSIRAFMFRLEYSKMTVQQHMYMWLKRGKLSYRQNCRCKVSRKATDKTCVPKSNDSCYADNAICSYNRKTKTCGWVNDDTCRE